MVQLIQMRQQIQAIESIKKITQAMRLISMSAHTQLGHRAPFIETYRQELLQILNTLQSFGKELNNSLVNPISNFKRTLIIVVGSQKGLAGNFNTQLFKLLEKDLRQNKFENIEFITVGKKVSDYIKKKHKIAYSFDTFSINSISKITNNIFDIITKANPLYTDVIFYSNFPKSFFVQIPKETVLIPSKNIENEKNSSAIETYVWEEPIGDVFFNLVKQYLHFSINSLLFNSLLSENAARFQSMDSATRNAQEILDNLKIQYNKVRQMKITNEIAELSSSL